MWKRRLIEAFAIVTLGDGLIEFLAPKEHSRLWVVGPKSTRRIAKWFAEKPNRMRVLGAAQVVLGVWLALRQHRDIGGRKACAASPSSDGRNEAKLDYSPTSFRQVPLARPPLCRPTPIATTRLRCALIELAPISKQTCGDDPSAHSAG